MAVRLKIIHATPARESHTPKNRSEEHTSELQSQSNLVCRLLLEKKNQHGNRAESAGYFAEAQREPGSGLPRPHVGRPRLERRQDNAMSILRFARYITLRADPDL